MITGQINAPQLARFRVIKVDRWRKRVLIQTWVHNAEESPIRRWYKMNDEHRQNITFKIN